MVFRFPLAQYIDDGSPLPAYRLPATKAEGSFRLVSGLPAPAEGHARDAVAELLRAARRAGPAGRRAASSSRYVNLARDYEGGVDVYPGHGEATLDRWRLNWEPVENGFKSGILKARGWTRVMDGLPLVAEHTLHMVEAEAARDILWKESRINLAALKSFLEFAPGIIPGLSRSPIKLLRLDHAVGEGAPLDGEVSFYDQGKLRAIRKALDKASNNAPWHDTPEGRKAISTGLHFSEPGEPETAFVSYYEGSELKADLDPIPLAGLAGKDLDLQRKAFRLRKEIDDTHRKLGAGLLDYRSDGQEGRAALDQVQLITALEDEIERKAAELAICYRDLVRVAARMREEILERVREAKLKAARASESTARVEGLREVYKPVSPTVTSHLAGNMTRLPVDLSLTRIGQGAGYGGFSVTRTVTNLVTGRDSDIQLDMVLTDHEPNGLADLQKAAQFFFGADGPSYMAPLLYVALSQDLGTKADVKGVRTITASEAFQRIRPGAAAEIRKDGVESWFKKNYKPLAERGMKAADVIKLALRVLSSVRVPYETTGPDKKKVPKVMTGLLYQTSETLVDKKGRVIFNYTWNPELGELVGGTETRSPSYMYSNNKALFSYSRHNLHTAPALQLTLENMARMAALKGGERMETVAGRLIVGRTPKGDDMSIATLVEKLGLVDERTSNLYRRICNALDAVEETGIAKVVRLAERPNKFEQKLRIEMSADYRDLYQREKLLREAEEAKAALEKPFEVKATQRRRGRPKSQKT